MKIYEAKYEVKGKEPVSINLDKAKEIILERKEKATIRLSF